MYSFNVYKERRDKAANERDLAKTQLQAVLANGDKVKASTLGTKIDYLSARIRAAAANMDMTRKRRWANAKCPSRLHAEDGQKGARFGGTSL